MAVCILLVCYLMAPVHSESNMSYLKKVVEDIESEKAVLTEHELIED